MSVLIKGMEMPKNCYECRFRQYEYCDMQRQDVYAVNIMDYALSLERHPNCPLVEIPTPHGRLIDADFEEMHYTSMTTNPTPDVTEQDKHNSLVIVRALQMAKTIIEAEE